MWLFTLVLASLITYMAFGHPSLSPVVDTMHGKVLGKYISLKGFTQPVAIFLGVPFASLPLGSLRFAPPKPAEPWSFVKNATSYPPMIVPQIYLHGRDSYWSDIYSPADLTSKGRLPVMVWIHGGGLLSGGASTFDGLALSTQENVVVVTIQYRLGIWGFLSTGDEHCGGNWGHLDQVAALQWVQDNIASFGGDPDSVTLFGESAGGETVSVLVLSPLAKNLFRRAISESGVALTPCLFRKSTRRGAEQVAIATGCRATTSADMVHCLRGKTEDELLETTLKMPLPLSSRKFFALDFLGDPRESYPFLTTVIDGVLLPKGPEEILAEKNFNTVPYIVEINKQEFGWFIPTVRIEHFLDSFQKISQELTPVATEKYLGGSDCHASKKDLFIDLMGDVLFAVPSVIVASYHRDAGAPTYMYEFKYRPSFVSDMRPKTVVADHRDEVYSVWGTPFLKDGASEEEINLSRMLMKFWGNFAHKGPQRERLPHWPEYDQMEGYLQIGAITQSAQKLKDKEVAFWTKLRAMEVVEKPTNGDTEK
uniref:Carboxylic ester hydrolase n=1 Tax=Nannospalax galili TaxID=1026970 RepID=A0A8C6WA04_NANGA